MVSLVREEIERAQRSPRSGEAENVRGWWRQRQLDITLGQWWYTNQATQYPLALFVKCQPTTATGRPFPKILIFQKYAGHYFRNSPQLSPLTLKFVNWMNLFIFIKCDFIIWFKEIRFILMSGIDFPYPSLVFKRSTIEFAQWKHLSTRKWPMMIYWIF